MGIVPHLDALWNLRLRQAARVNHRILALDLLPFKALLIAGDIEALAVLAGNVEQAARHLGAHVAVTQFERGGLDGEGTAVFGNQLFIDAAGTVTDDALGVLAED